ncbi:MAG: ATP-dependent Clp protease ATP-binding subunit [Treponema sp.]|nr:ATP-dependent Clp protease ATP-binding subunit [Treponema sp.]
MKNMSPMAQRLIGALAQDEGRLSGVDHLLPEHVILALLKSKNGIGYEVCKALNLNIDRFEYRLKSYFGEHESKDGFEDLPYGHRYVKMQDIADIESNTLGNDYVGTEHFLLAAIREEYSLTANYFSQYGKSLSEVRKEVLKLQKQGISSSVKPMDVSSVFKDIMEKTDEINMLAGLEEESKASKPKDKKVPQSLSEYARDLTNQAKNGKLDSVIGREKEINRLIQILLRRTKNNPVITGDSGVGKTSVVEGLALKIVNGDVPKDLIGKKIYSLDLAQMVAGTKYRGDFEERMKKMMKEITDRKDIILFIDEIHMMIGAGAPDGNMDASNILKPALSRGEIQIIGATTTKEYTKVIEKDQALERRFQKVLVEEPTSGEALEILNGIKEKYENYHHVKYDDEVIPAIVSLSCRYIPERSLPDKAIDILDECGCAKKISEENNPEDIAEIEKAIDALAEEKRLLVENQEYENAAYVRDKVIELREKLNELKESAYDSSSMTERIVTKRDVEHVISEMTGIPLEQMNSQETSRLINMEKEIHEAVIGQDEAVNVIASSIRRSRAGISSPKRPVGSYIFLGPTGVGKTKLAKTLAKFVFGNEDALIRIDMSDFMEKHNASRLVGSPPGYVGYEDGGVLTEKVRHHPYSVVLLDEIEKAHPDVFNLLLQILEEGELQDNLGHTINFRNTIIIMTSNAGARQITNEGRAGFAPCDGAVPFSEIKHNAVNELKKLLSPELLNRIDDVIVFNALNKTEISKILDLQLNELQDRLSDKKLTLNLSENARNYLIENGYDPAMGARPMRRLIQKEIEDPLALEILSKNTKNCDIIDIDYGEKLEIKLTRKSTVPVSVLR